MIKEKGQDGAKRQDMVETESKAFVLDNEVAPPKSLFWQLF